MPKKCHPKHVSQSYAQHILLSSPLHAGMLMISEMSCVHVHTKTYGFPPHSSFTLSHFDKKNDLKIIFILFFKPKLGIIELLLFLFFNVIFFFSSIQIIHTYFFNFNSKGNFTIYF